MNTSQAICRMREAIRRQHQALSCAVGLAARQAKPLPLEVASTFGQEVSRILAMGYRRSRPAATPRPFQAGPSGSRENKTAPPWRCLNVWPGKFPKIGGWLSAITD